MKQLLYILFAVTLFTACSSDDDDNTQDYTSFVFHQTVNNTLPNCIAAYKKDGKFYKIANLGELSKDKYSSDVRVNDNAITEIYFFTDYNGGVRFDTTYKLKKNTKNIFDLLESIGGIGFSDKSDPTQYPQ